MGVLFVINEAFDVPLQPMQNFSPKAFVCSAKESFRKAQE